MMPSWYIQVYTSIYCDIILVLVGRTLLLLSPLIHTASWKTVAGYARPQLFFTCHLRPICGQLPKNGLFKICPGDHRDLVFFNTFEELKLPIKGPMEDAGLIKLYAQSPTSCLYVAPVEDITGRVPLILVFLAGNSTQTVPHFYSKHKDPGFPMGCAAWQQCV